MKSEPCPLCGGEAITESRFVSYEGVVTIRHDVICNGCGCKIENFQSKEQAINRWNRREPIDKIVEALEAERTKAAANYNSSIGSHAIESCGRMYGFLKSIEIVKGGSV